MKKSFAALSVSLALACNAAASSEFFDPILQELDDAALGPVGEVYEMVTAEIRDGELCFASDEDFDEALHVGFFRIKCPAAIDLEVTRNFARSFPHNERYRQFGVLDVVNGFLQSQDNQTVRFTLERDHWDRCYVDLQQVEGPPNYPLAVQKVGHQLHALGSSMLTSILRRFGLPEELWFEATAGASHSEGSHFLLFNHYDPKLGNRPHGVAQHADWGWITVLDAVQPGLEAYIDGQWRPLSCEEGYLTVNFGYPLQKLLPAVKASVHRVVTQTKALRTSTVAFIDPRIGPYRSTAPEEWQGRSGQIYDWDAEQECLVNPQDTTAFFTGLSEALYGSDQSGAE